MTETSPVVSVNRPDSYQFGSVGRALDNVRVRTAPDGELMIKAPSVMMGYWRQQGETSASCPMTAGSQRATSERLFETDLSDQGA